jgi:hypothetical protein
VDKRTAVLKTVVSRATRRKVAVILASKDRKIAEWLREQIDALLLSAGETVDLQELGGDRAGTASAITPTPQGEEAREHAAVA